MDSKHLIKKIVLLGDSAVGKTSLMRRYVIDNFDDKYIATIGTKVSKKEIEFKLPGKTIFLTMQIWDVLGQREFKKVRSIGIEGSDGVLLVADLTRPETIAGLLDFWYPQVQQLEGDLPTILIGNKADILKDGNEAKDKLSSAAEEMSSPFFICSAKTGENVENSFKSLGELVIGGFSESQTHGESKAKSSISGAIDFIMDDFCMQDSDPQKAMDVIEKLFLEVGIDINSPTKEQALEAIELMAESEKDHLGRDIAEVNKLRRWRILEESSEPK